jgi:aspartate/methionine/tyrosine aminotransferase
MIYPSGSRRLRLVQEAIIPLIDELVQKCPDTISLGQGVVHYPPPDVVHKQLQKFWSNTAHHRYGPILGEPTLHAQIREKLEKENQIDLSDRSIVVTAGSNMGFLNVVLAITDPGDEVILLLPYFFNQEMAVRIAGCKPVLVDTDTNYQPVRSLLEQAITPKTRAIVTVSPNNPTGVVYGEAVLREINALCHDRKIYHVTDEAYEYFVYEDARHFSPGSIPNSRPHTISLYSLSKSYGFAGWRIGYLVAPSELQGSLEKIQDTNAICPSIPGQYAAVGALEAGREYCRPFIERMNFTRRAVLQALSEVSDRIERVEPNGAFYVFIKIRNPTVEDMDLARSLIEKYRVAAIPGRAFGIQNPCCLRVSYGALRPEMVAEGLGRLVEGISHLA